MNTNVIKFLLLLLFLQVNLGMMNIMTQLNLHVALTHNIVGAILLLAMVTLIYQLHVRSEPA